MNHRNTWQIYLLRVINGDETGASALIIRTILSFLEVIFRILSGLKFIITRRRRLPVPVISVGNITVGGTGKTPSVIWLVNLFKTAGFNPAVLTRGYGGTHEKGGLIFTNADLKALSADSTGDEPFLLAESLPDTLIAMGRERYTSGLRALAAYPGIDLFILDDGFQHWSLARDLDIVVMDASRPFDNGHLIPRGLLREPLSSLKRAGVILLTRTAKVAPDHLFELTRELMKRNPLLSVASIVEKPNWLVPLTDFANGSKERAVWAPEFLKSRRVAAITGIGNPRQFLASLENMGAEVGYFKAYPDHYPFQEAEIIDLIKGLAENGFTELIITAKDGVKLEPWAASMASSGVTCYILSLEFTVDDPEAVQKIKKVMDIDKTGPYPIEKG